MSIETHASVEAGPPPLPPSVEKGVDARRILYDLLSARWLDPETALEIVARFDVKRLREPSIREGLRTLAYDFGLDVSKMPPRQLDELRALYAICNQVKQNKLQEDLQSALARGLQEALLLESLNAVERLKVDVKSAVEGGDKAKAEQGLYRVMESLKSLSLRIDPQTEIGAVAWSQVSLRFQELLKMKRGATEVISQSFSAIFHEFSDFIEDKFVAAEAQRLQEAGQMVEGEAIMRSVYGRTPKEMEAIKVANRKKVVKEIQKMKEEPYITLGMIERLYEINNLGIIPKAFSKFRADAERDVSYGQAGRIGILAPDVKREMWALLERAEELTDQSILGGWSDARYGVAAAKLHNDFVEIHPFLDRNGSTALLFLELLMAKRGYEPSEIREPNFYKQVHAILGSNLPAIGLVGYEMCHMAYHSGYFKGVTVDLPGRKKRYEERVKEFGQIRSARMQQIKELMKAQEKKRRAQQGNAPKVARAV